MLPPETEHGSGVASSPGKGLVGAPTHPVSCGGSEQVGTMYFSAFSFTCSFRSTV